MRTISTILRVDMYVARALSLRRVLLCRGRVPPTYAPVAAGLPIQSNNSGSSGSSRLSPSAVGSSGSSISLFFISKVTQRE